jgi:F-type H+-transporting ATPase subunit b
MKSLLIATALLVAPRIVHAQVDEPKTEARVDDAEGKTEPVDPDPSEHFNYTNFHYSGKDEYGGKYGDGVETNKQGVVLHEEEPMSPPFVFMLINFGFLLIILGKYGAPVAKKLAQDRHDQIKDALDEAAKLRDQAAKKLAEFETRIKDVDTEIKTLVDGIRKDAETDKARILEAATAQAAQMKRDAELRIAAEIALARMQLTQEVTAAAVTATEKILKDKATPDDQRTLVSTFVSGLGAPQ